MCNGGVKFALTWILTVDNSWIKTLNNNKKFILEKLECGSNEFQCGTEECISERFVCDGNKDCRNGRDELNCKVAKNEVKCKEEEFMCSEVNRICVPLSSRSVIFLKPFFGYK